jgi:hypothetical protein
MLSYSAISQRRSSTQPTGELLAVNSVLESDGDDHQIKIELKTQKVALASFSSLKIVVFFFN